MLAEVMLDDELIKTRDEMAREEMAKYPSLTDTDAEQLAQVKIGVTFAFPGATEEKLQARVKLLIHTEAEDGAPWALNVLQAIVDDVFRPFYDKAVAIGADPVPVLMTNCGISRKEARSVVKNFQKEAAGPDDAEG